MLCAVLSIHTPPSDRHNLTVVWKISELFSARCTVVCTLMHSSYRWLLGLIFAYFLKLGPLYCHTMLCVSTAIMRRLSVFLSVTFVYCIKTNKDIFRKISLSSSHTVLVIPYRTSWQYSNGDPLNRGALSAGGVGTLSQYLAPSRAVNSLTECNTVSCDEPWQVGDTSCW